MNFNKEIQVSGEEIFRVFERAMFVPPTTSGYTLNYSGNGVDFLAWDEETPASTANYVRGFDSGLYFKLVGNTDDLIVNC